MSDYSGDTITGELDHQMTRYEYCKVRACPLICMFTTSLTETTIQNKGKACYNY